MNIIAFIGDSFCSNYGLDDFNRIGGYKNQVGTLDPVHPDIVVKHFKSGIAPYGYGGRSWWYSRTKFVYDWDWRPEAMKEQLSALIFFHTDHNRINNSWNDDLGMLQNAKNNVKSGRVVEDFYKYINDEPFDFWAQEQWFRQIKRDYSDFKTVHFHCFPFTLPLSHLLPGVVFTTPLIHISMGELIGTDQEILTQCGATEKRHNHLNSHNNQALAQVIINALETMEPGQYEIPMDNFHQINPNANNYPNAGFGTK